MPRGDCQSQPCRCAQHRTETFGGSNDAAHSYASARDAAEYFVDRHFRFGRAVDDYLAGLPEVEDAAATVVELVQRGESWHIAIRAGKMYHETAEDSLGAAFEAVGRVLGEDPE